MFGGYFMVVNEMVLDLFKANGKNSSLKGE